MDSSSRQPDPLRHVADAMQQRLDSLPAGLEHRRDVPRHLPPHHAGGREGVGGGLFEDPEWVERWDVAFAELYLSALDAHLSGGAPSRPWRLAFDAPADLPALRLVLLGINAHVNYDLPQALLAVITDEDFTDQTLMDRRRRDHERIDGVLAGRVAAEDDELAAARRARSLDRALQPLNRVASKRFLREARLKVWHNTDRAPGRRGSPAPTAYDARLAELEVLSAARIADLLAPGQVLLRLAVAGFGVTLPPPA